MKNNTQDTSSELLTVTEVSRILRVDATTVRRWCSNGALEVVILPHAHERKAYRIRRSTIEAMIGQKLP